MARYNIRLVGNKVRKTRLSPASENSCCRLFTGFSRLKFGVSAAVANVTPPCATVARIAIENATVKIGTSHLPTAKVVIESTGTLPAQSVLVLLVSRS